MLRLLGFPKLFLRIQILRNKWGSLIQSLILEGDRPSQKYLSALRVQNWQKISGAPGPSPISATYVVMGICFSRLAIRLCLTVGGRENSVDRPTFERLRNTMEEMERNYKVRRVRTFLKREKQSWIRKVHLGKKLLGWIKEWVSWNNL